MPRYKCATCNAETDAAQPPKWCRTKGCAGKTFLVVPQQPTVVFTPVLNMSASLIEPRKESDITGAFLDIMISAHERVFGDAGNGSSHYVRMKKLRAGREVVISKDVNDFKVLSKQLRTKLLASEARAADMRRWVGALLGTKKIETIYRNCSDEEATEVNSLKVLRQKPAASMDKYKWIFVDRSHPPVESKKPPRRIYMTVPEGTIKMLQRHAQPHLGSSEAAIVTRDTSLTRLAGETHEPGTFGIHGDVLPIFSELIKAVAITTNV
ncbi:hypothetical protein WME94_57800 [Sorangium sp. So ce429]